MADLQNGTSAMGGGPSSMGGLDPALIQAIMGSTSGQEQLDQYKQQLALASALRTNMPAPNEMAGRVVVKHNPLEYAADAARNVMAAQQMSQATKGSQSTIDKMTKARQAGAMQIIQMLRDQQQQRAQQGQNIGSIDDSNPNPTTL